MKTGIELIAEERKRQQEVEGFVIERDAELYKDNELIRAALCYAIEPEHREAINEDMESIFDSGFWPWDESWFKSDPNDRVRDLVKAGALIAAAIDQIKFKDLNNGKD